MIIHLLIPPSEKNRIQSLFSIQPFNLDFFLFPYQTLLSFHSDFQQPSKTQYIINDVKTLEAEVHEEKSKIALGKIGGFRRLCKKK